MTFTIYLKLVYKEENNGLIVIMLCYIIFIFSTNGSQINGKKIKKNEVKDVKIE